MIILERESKHKMIKHLGEILGAYFMRKGYGTTMKSVKI